MRRGKAVDISSIAALATLLFSALAVRADNDSLAVVRRAEQARIEMIDRVSPAVVCIFNEKQRGGGSGVIIDPDGTGLTNYHVVAGMLGSRRGLGGLSDGRLYELEVLGVDPTGDVAMFRLKGRDRFPHVPLGDSSVVEVGDTAIAIGNPFILSEDFTPSVTTGLVTGIHRYQWGVGNNLIYSDCIQIDAPINPGNSGGPLFNTRGEVIGINGRISVNTRGRFNVGFGYAISANQIKRFMPSLRAGLLARHGTLHIQLEDVPEVGVMIVDVRPDHVGDRMGLRVGDMLLRFAEHEMDSRNRYASVLGTYPANWPVAVEVMRDDQPLRLIDRLDPVEPKLRKPYAAKREQSVRRIERVIRKYSEIVLGDRSIAGTDGWTVALRRTRDREKAADQVSDQLFISQFGDQRATLTKGHGEESGNGQLIEFDDREATMRVVGVDEPLKFGDTVEEMLLGSRYVILRIMLGSPDALDLSEVTHAGVDAPMPSPSATATDVGEIIYEVLEWPVGVSGIARFAFDATSGLLRRVDVRDRISGAEASMTLVDYRDFNGIQFPAEMRVKGSGVSYVDRVESIEAMR